MTDDIIIAGYYKRPKGKIATVIGTVEKEEPVFDVTNCKDTSGRAVPIVKRISE